MYRGENRNGYKDVVNIDRSVERYIKMCTTCANMDTGMCTDTCMKHVWTYVGYVFGHASGEVCAYVMPLR